MGIFFGVLFGIIISGTLVVCYLLVQKQKTDKPPQPDDMGNLLVIERVSGEYRAETELQLSKRAHSDLLIAGDAVVGMILNMKLDLALQTISVPVSEELKNRVSQGDIPERLTPRRVRAAVAVGEISMALENLMQDFGNHQADTLFVILDEEHGVINIGDQRISVSYVIQKIACKIEVYDNWECGDDYPKTFDGYAVAGEIWKAVVALLREGKTRIPGLRVNKDVVIVPKIIVNE